MYREIGKWEVKVKLTCSDQTHEYKGRYDCIHDSANFAGFAKSTIMAAVITVTVVAAPGVVT